MSSHRPTPRPKKQDPHSSTITPQRKHRKLLKDGSGTEVWPEAIEKIFVQGLKEYWESPYATYSQSRGRSRWRNQFLVDYLHKRGIERSKKQVASHIQVLRNMWKGEPEYALVAGGDELGADDSPAPMIKSEESSLVPFDFDDGDHTVSPDFSPADSQSEFPPTPEHRPNLYPAEYGVKPHVMSFDYPYSDFGTPPISPTDMLADSAFPMFAPQSKYAVRAPESRSTRPYRSSRNRVTGLYLAAEGMTPFAVNLQGLATGTAHQQPPFAIRLRLCVPSPNDVRSPPNLSGFMATVSLESVWERSGRCVTKLYSNGTPQSEETGPLDITHITAGTANVSLPQSPLSQCRWYPTAHNLTITQEIIVDDELLLIIVHELDRTHGPLPAVNFVGYQKWRPADKTNSVSPVAPQPMFFSPAQYPPATPPLRYPQYNV